MKKYEVTMLHHQPWLAERIEEVINYDRAY